MSEITELTIKLIKLGVRSKSGGKVTLWTIKSALAWLREKGYWYDRNMAKNGRLEIVVYKIEDAWIDCGDDILVDVMPENELEGLLECMIKIAKEKL